MLALRSLLCHYWNLNPLFNAVVRVSVAAMFRRILSHHRTLSACAHNATTRSQATRRHAPNVPPPPSFLIPRSRPLSSKTSQSNEAAESSNKVRQWTTQLLCFQIKTYFDLFVFCRPKRTWQTLKIPLVPLPITFRRSLWRLWRERPTVLSFLRDSESLLLPDMLFSKSLFFNLRSIHLPLSLSLFFFYKENATCYIMFKYVYLFHYCELVTGTRSITRLSKEFRMMVRSVNFFVNFYFSKKTKIEAKITPAFLVSNFNYVVFTANAVLYKK